MKKLGLPGLTTQVLIGLAVGVLIGWLLPGVGARLDVLSRIFIRLILVIIAPLVFSTLVVGIASSGREAGLGGLAARAFLYFFMITAVALLLGMLAGHLVQPGAGITILSSRGSEAKAVLENVSGWESFWVGLFPRNIVESLAHGDVLQIVVFALVFSLAMRAAGDAAGPVLAFCRSLAAIMHQFTSYVMVLAPVGVMAAAAAAIARHGVAVLLSFGKLAATVFVGLAVLLLVVFPLLALWFHVPLRRFWQAAKDAVLVTFATASSSAGLPKAITALEELGLPPRTVAFVMATALNFNMAGTTLFIGVAALFIAQAGGIALSGSQFVQLFLTLFFVSKGVPAVPRGSLVLLAGGLSSFGLPPDVIAAGIAMLLGVDPLLDMARSGTNMAGHCLATAIAGGFRGSQSLGAGAT